MITRLRIGSNWDKSGILIVSMIAHNTHQNNTTCTILGYDSPLDNNCAAKGAMALTGGYGMGLLFGLFMNAMSHNEVQMGKSFAATTK